jgi:hypothetical protein
LIILRPCLLCAVAIIKLLVGNEEIGDVSDLAGCDVLAPRQAGQFVEVASHHPLVKALLDECFVLTFVGVVAGPEVNSVHRAERLIVHVVRVLIIQHQIKIVAVQFHLSLGIVPFDRTEIVTGCSDLYVQFDTVFFRAILAQ